LLGREAIRELLKELGRRLDARGIEGAMAARQETDGEDLHTLAKTLRLTNLQEGLELVERFYGPVRLTMKTQLILESVLGPTK
jgi:hypothetical protein